MSTSRSRIDFGFTSNIDTAMSGYLQRSLIEKYDVPGPRYTSYPTAPNFRADFNFARCMNDLADKRASTAPLSLYVHIPFCHNICYYCACNKIVTSDTNAARRYLRALGLEIQQQSQWWGSERPVTQLHFGGGTPTFLSDGELAELMYMLAHHFNMRPDQEHEYSVEIDPRTVNAERLALLKGLGFNRLSMGIQDFEPEVQKAVNREQSLSEIDKLVRDARALGFDSLSFDLIYGLPKQSCETLTRTLEQTVQLGPDRIAFYNYAHLPERFKSQRAIDRLTLPSAQQKLDMLELISSQLREAGYVHIGMDHFVLPDDSLAVAQRTGRMQRNFQGYSTVSASDLVGLGVSAISSSDTFFIQNERDIDAYYKKTENKLPAYMSGLYLSHDDIVRRYIIQSLTCRLTVDLVDFKHRFGTNFEDYFRETLPELAVMEQEFILELSEQRLSVSESGRRVLRNICMCFDNHLSHNQDLKFSKAI